MSKVFSTFVVPEVLKFVEEFGADLRKTLKDPDISCQYLFFPKWRMRGTVTRRGLGKIFKRVTPANANFSGRFEIVLSNGTKVLLPSSGTIIYTKGKAGDISWTRRVNTEKVVGAIANGKAVV